MDAFALTLILLSAFVHVVPHLAIKGAADRNAFVWWMLAANAVLYAPMLRREETRRDDRRATHRISRSIRA